MDTWVYKREIIGNMSEVIGRLNLAGADGWELIGFEASVYIFKRKLENVAE